MVVCVSKWVNGLMEKKFVFAIKKLFYSHLFVNFINILHAHFALICLRQKILNPKHSFEIFGAKILYKKTSV